MRTGANLAPRVGGAIGGRNRLHWFVKMRHVTITLEDKVLRWARGWVERHDTSVSRLVGELLEKRRRRQEGYEAAMKRFLAREPRPLKRSGGYPSRDEVHER